MKINIVPLKFSNRNLLYDIASSLNSIYGFETEIIIIPIEVQSKYSTDRRQYNSSGILQYVITQTDKIEGKVLVLTELDLYVPALTFVFGEAQLKGKHSIVSACRLHEEFYTGVTEDVILKNRLLKEILHELGHNFGLLHCISWDCVMHSSNTIV